MRPLQSDTSAHGGRRAQPVPIIATLERVQRYCQSEDLHWLIRALGEAGPECGEEEVAEEEDEATSDGSRVSLL